MVPIWRMKQNNPLPKDCNLLLRKTSRSEQTAGSHEGPCSTPSNVWSKFKVSCTVSCVFNMAAACWSHTRQTPAWALTPLTDTMWSPECATNYFLNFYWQIVALQDCASFCCIAVTQPHIHIDPLCSRLYSHIGCSRTPKNSLCCKVSPY